MKPFTFVLIALWLLLLPVRAADVELPATERLPGVDLAQGVTELTGVAISPLLGVSAVGAWHYFRAPEAKRAHLPWFCHPSVWGVGLCLIGLCFLKDLIGTAAPPLLKKPLDALELFENKLSALVACSAFVPFVVSQMTRHAPEISLALSPDVQFASVLAVGGFDFRIITIPLAIIGFLVIWLAGHAINVLITLCPFGLVDGVLKLFKMFLLSSVVASSFISPWLGAAVSLVILFVAGLVAPWAFRLTVFGTLFGLDVLLPGRARRRVRATEPHAFLARPIAGTPVRTYGHLTRSADGSVTFTYRPWLILPQRVVSIPQGHVAIAKGVLFPSLLHSAGEQPQARRIVVMFLPRYRSHEEAIATHFAIVDIQDSPLLKGYRAIRGWFAESFNFGKTRREELQST